MCCGIVCKSRILGHTACVQTAANFICIQVTIPASEKFDSSRLAYNEFFTIITGQLQHSIRIPKARIQTIMKVACENFPVDFPSECCILTGNQLQFQRIHACGEALVIIIRHFYTPIQFTIGPTGMARTQKYAENTDEKTFSHAANILKIFIAENRKQPFKALKRQNRIYPTFIPLL